MATVEIEERAWSDPRMKPITALVAQGKLKVPPIAGVIGTLALIWHDSQEQFKCSTTVQELSIWLGLSIEETERWMSAFVDAGGMKLGENGEIKISGNSRRVTKVRARRKASRDAAKARWQKFESKIKSKKNNNQQGMPDALRTHEKKPMQTQCPDIEIKRYRDKEIKREITLLRNVQKPPAKAEFSSDDETHSDHKDDRFVAPWDEPDNAPPVTPEIVVYEPDFQAEKKVAKRTRPETPKRAVVGKTTPRIEGSGSRNTTTRPKAKNATALKSDVPIGINEVVAEYCAAYKERYGMFPPRTGRLAGSAKSLAKEFGVEKARLYIRAYLKMGDSFFVKKRHPIEYILGNINAVGQFAEQGVEISNATAKAQERSHHNDLVADRVIKYYENEGDVIDVR